MLRQIVEKQPDTMAGVADNALIGACYDTLRRSSELAAMRVEHLRPSADGEWSVMLVRSKCDQAGDGRIARLSPGTTRVLQRWLDQSGMEEGLLFRSLHLGRPSESATDTSSIRRLVKRAASIAGVEVGTALGLSGRSMRVGAARDMLFAGFDAR